LTFLSLAGREEELHPTDINFIEGLLTLWIEVVRCLPEGHDPRIHRMRFNLRRVHTLYCMRKEKAAPSFIWTLMGLRGNERNKSLSQADLAVTRARVSKGERMTIMLRLRGVRTISERPGRMLLLSERGMTNQGIPEL